MAPQRPFEHRSGPAARARDAALRRLSVLNGVAAGGSAALAVGFTAMAAHATPARHPAVAGEPAVVADARSTVGHVTSDRQKTTRRRRRHRTAGSSSTGSGSSAATPATQGPTATTQAPTRTTQPPVVVSGGS